MIQFNQKGNDFYMNVQETLFFIRKKKNINQRELLTYMDSSVYSKIESGKKNLKFSELIEILNKLSISLDEFSKYFTSDTTGKKMRSLLEEYRVAPESPLIKTKICAYFHSLIFSREMLLEEMSNYIVIKTFFSNQWAEIPSISKNELAAIFMLLQEKQYYFHYDYVILSNTIYLFSEKQIDLLMKKAFPVQDMVYRNAATKEFIINLLFNLIITFLRKKEYEKCEYYIILAKEEKGEYDLAYKIMLNFLENLVCYIQIKDPKAKKQLETTLNFLSSVGEFELAQALRLELENVLSADKDPIVILRNQFNQQH